MTVPRRTYTYARIIIRRYYYNTMHKIIGLDARAMQEALRSFRRVEQIQT